MKKAKIKNKRWRWMNMSELWIINGWTHEEILMLKNIMDGWMNNCIE